ncbi:MAG: hypothetical protein R6U70_07460 [Bacillota bacterium]
MSDSISAEKLECRRRQLRRRKYSFVELIMQTKKSLYKDKMRDRWRSKCGD